MPASPRFISGARRVTDFSARVGERIPKRAASACSFAFFQESRAFPWMIPIKSSKGDGTVSRSVAVTTHYQGYSPGPVQRKVPVRAAEAKADYWKSVEPPTEAEAVGATGSLAAPRAA